MAGTPSGPLRSILLDRREPVLHLTHGVRIPIDPAIVKIVAEYREEDIDAGEFRMGDDDYPGDVSPFPLEAYYPGGSGSISPHCYLLRVSYPCEFHILATHEYLTTTWSGGDSMGGWWREDLVVPNDEVTQLCSDYGADVLDDDLRRRVDEHEEKHWSAWSRQRTDEYELVQSPEGTEVHFKGGVARFHSDERVACRFFCAMLRAMIKDLSLKMPLDRLRTELRSESRGPRWAYNLCQIINSRIAPLELGFQLACPKGSEVVTWEPIENDIPILKDA